MRRRRIERCLLNAATALEEGALDRATEAVEEAERLDPSDEPVRQLAERIRIARAAPPPLLDLPLRESASGPELGRTAAGVGSGPHRGTVVHVRTPLGFRSEAAPNTGVGVRDPAEVKARSAPATAPEPSPAHVVVPQNSAGDTGPLLGATAPEPASSGSRRWLAAAAALIALSGAAGWFWTQVTLDQASHQSALTSPSPSAAPASPRPLADPIASQPTDAAAPSPAAPIDDVQASPPAAEQTAATTGATPDPNPVVPTATENVAPSAVSNAVENRVTPAVHEPTAERPDLPVVALPSARTDEASSVPSKASAENTGPAPAKELPTPAPTLPPMAPVESSALGAPIGEPVASPPPAVATPPPAVPDDRGVMAILSRYESAYTQLDANAVAAVWPSVDRRALARAFDGLASQNVKLGRCQVRITGNAANAECVGNANWRQKIGGEPRMALRRWTFELKNTGADWIIVSANVR